MRIAYFDCFAGISGDMTLGALVAAGADFETLRESLASLPVHGYELQSATVKKMGIAATDITVALSHHHHHHRRLGDIVEIINGSTLSDDIKSTSIRIFTKLAEAEAHVHGSTVDDVHFHEVGAVDAIVDIVGTAICLELLGIDRVEASPLPLFHGFVESAHGTFPLPAPATAELIKGIPVRGRDIEGELVTPTGAAIVTTLASKFGSPPDFRIESIGYGAGKADRDIPNVLRVVIGEGTDVPSVATEPMLILETNIDDMNPQLFDSAFDHLFAAGARDVFLTPIQMKKNRPATLLSVLCDPSSVNTMLSIIYAETSTLGVRIQDVSRACLDREFKTVETKYGPIRIKIGNQNGVRMNASPEYEDCRAAATANDVATKAVYEEAMAAFLAG
jgi:pyridinium-3,5-bisthiocarboxylic acid mononucleotide nickel chelatase